MMLFVRKGCDFCRDLPKVDDLVIIEVSQTPRGPKMMVEGRLMPIPPAVRGLPALVIGTEVTLGKNTVKARVAEIVAEQALKGNK
jgi:hypothetical protein